MRIKFDLFTLSLALLVCGVCCTSLMSLIELPDDYDDIMLEIDDEIIFDYNSSIPYRFQYEAKYYTNCSSPSNLTSNSIIDNEIPSEELFNGFLYLQKLINLKKKTV